MFEITEPYSLRLSPSVLRLVFKSTYLTVISLTVIVFTHNRTAIGLEAFYLDNSFLVGHAKMLTPEDVHIKVIYDAKETHFEKLLTICKIVHNFCIN